MDTFIRGSTIEFHAVCTDANGAPVTPDSADLHLKFLDRDGDVESVTVAMTVSGANLSAVWESADADTLISPSGWRPVRWSITAAGDSTIVQDGEFLLTSNEANP